jgi:Cu(I)/Ag(I) efflux system membrane fusion protein
MRPNPKSLALVGIGLILGLALAGILSLAGRGNDSSSAAAPAGSVWTCSMHPQIRMSRPGRCPICGMDLVPVRTEGATGTGGVGSSTHLTLSEHAKLMASVATVAVEERELQKEIRTVGKVELDETRVRNISARVAGRIDEVYANFPGIVVKVGDHLVRIYSPDLFATQQELLLSLRREKEPAAAAGPNLDQSLAASARERLRLWGLTEEQLDALVRTGKPQTYVTVYAPLGGTVIQKEIREGQYVEPGASLYTIADLTHVWLIIDVYESEISWVRFGQSVQVTLESEPARSFGGTVAFIEPVLNESTRTIRVRVVLRNEEGRFKPGMYAQALLRIGILPGGKPAPTGLEGRYACPMHPNVVADGPGDCTVCGMPLEKVPGEPAPEGSGAPRTLAVPVEAVLTTGRRSLVYVEVKAGQYQLVEPKLGPRAGDYYPVIEGLEKGQRVVTRGSFLIDSQFQISGMPSLLYPEGISGGGVGHAGHQGPGAQEGGAKPAVEKPQRPEGHENHDDSKAPQGPEGHKDD